MADARYGVTVFHAFGHKFSCQVRYNPRYIEGFGMTDGEGMERFWLHLSGYVKLTRTMTRANREMTLLEGVRNFCDQKMESIGMLKIA